MDFYFDPKLHIGEPELKYRFFCVFNVFEYALKANGYALSSRWDGVKPDWERFIDEIEADFNKLRDPSLDKAQKYLFAYPPRRQVLRNGFLEWKENERPSDDTDIQWLLNIVKTVRNNLFHGGKIPFDPKRDTRLLHSCFQVLLAWASIKPEFNRVVQDAYQEVMNKP